jgi:flagellar biosynthesis/type III secretory pathway protein FliH
MEESMNKFIKLFKWRVRLVQQGYDLGWEHGYEAGMIEQKNQIVDKVDKFVKDVDWLKEEPYTRKDIVEAIKNHEPEKELVGWAD